MFKAEEVDMVKVESGSRPGLYHRVHRTGNQLWCSCEATTFGASDCTHRRLRRVQIRNESGTYHRVSERRGIYGPYFVVVNHEDQVVTGPTFSKLEALGWAAEQDAEAPLEPLEVSS